MGQAPQLTNLQLPPNPLHILLPVFGLHQVALVDELHKLLGQDPMLQIENTGWAPLGGSLPSLGLSIPISTMSKQHELL